MSATGTSWKPVERVEIVAIRTTQTTVSTAVKITNRTADHSKLKLKNRLRPA